MAKNKLKLSDKIKEAISIQDAARSKIKGWNGIREIRKWRERKDQERILQ